MFRHCLCSKSARKAPAFPTARLGLEHLEDRLVPSGANPDASVAGLQQNIQHIVVIYQENWSFDGLYGNFPGANGIANATDANGNLLPQYQQVDKNGNPITTLPNPSTDPHVPGGLPARPYDLSQYVAPDQKTNDIVHRFYTEQLQIGNGALQPGADNNSKFVTWSDNKNLVLSHFDATNLPEGQLAQQYTLDDNFFHAAYGGSFLNHQFLVAAAAPPWNQPIPAGFQSSWDPTTQTLKDGNLTIDGKYAVNTTFAAQAPHPAGIDPAKLLQPINDVDPTKPGYTTTIGDLLDAAGVSWNWYSGGWDNALAGHADPLFQYHHQPFAYYAKYAPLNPDGSQNPQTSSLLNPDAHLQDEQRFFADLAAGNLPAVSFIKPLGPDNEHPGYASLLQGQQHVADIVAALQNSPDWAHTAVIITYDENGGRWDHVAPPQANGPWGDGTRVPAIVISPYAQRGYVDHTQHDTLSILKTIEEDFTSGQGLNNAGGYDTRASDLLSDFQFPGVHVAGSELHLVGSTGNDFFLVTPAGSHRDGSTGVNVLAIINGQLSFQTFNQPFTALDFYLQSGGNDTVQVDPRLTVAVNVHGGDGNNLIQGGAGDTVVHLGSGSNAVFLGNGNDTVTGPNGATGSDLVVAGNGNDRVSLGGQNDAVFLGNGNDSVTLTGSGAAAVLAGNGNDTVTGGDGNYSIILGNGDDSVSVGNGNSLIYVGTGHNTVGVGSGTNTVFLNEDDVLTIAPGGHTTVYRRPRH
jgi:phospholipase C